MSKLKWKNSKLQEIDLSKKRENPETNCRPPSRLQNHLDA